MEEEKSYDPRDTNLRFVNADDDHDFACVGYRSQKALMSCGHSVTPQSLSEWCLRQLQEGKVQFGCGVCSAVWPFDEVSKMALLTDNEQKTFEEKRFQNFAFNHLKAKTCPGCEAFALRKDPNNLCVRCLRCSAQTGQTYDFCWQCLREWRNGADSCGNEGCVPSPLQTLSTCPVMEFDSVKGVTGCPSVRACPTCGALATHNTKNCKNIVCPDCKVEFCFVCLKLTKKCLKTSTHFEPCSSGVAPRQTSVPVRSNSKSESESESESEIESESESE